jgi:hypothetical protein
LDEKEDGGLHGQDTVPGESQAVREAPAATAFVLTVRHPDGSEAVVALREETVTIGRAAINTVVLKDALASRFHARIEWESGRYLLTDRGSKNGVVVRGSAVSSHVLAAGDEILVGDTVLLFHAAGDAAAPGGPSNGDRPDALEAMAHHLAAAEDLDALEQVVVHLRSLIACDRCALVLFEEGGPRVRRRFARSAGPAGSTDGPDDTVLEAGWSADRPAAVSLARDPDSLDGTLDVSRYVLLVPVSIEDRKEALLSLEREATRPPFTSDELRLAAAAATPIRSFLRRF